MMLVLAAFGFGLSFFSYGLILIPLLLILFLFGIAPGIFGSALVLRPSGTLQRRSADLTSPFDPRARRLSNSDARDSTLTDE